MQSFKLKQLSTMIALALACQGAWASDAEGEFHGYFRAGFGSSSAKGPQSCYGLGGYTQRYRLGNECDTYAEFEYQKAVMPIVEGVSFVGHVMVAAYSPKSDVGDADINLSKLYVEAKGLPFLNGGTAWVGKRYYFRPDIHMLDFQYINMNGTGAGIDQIPLGAGRFSYAVFKDNEHTDVTGSDGKTVSTTNNAALRQNLIYQGLPLNPNGTLDAAVSLITAQGDKSTHNGWQVSLFHKQDKVLGGGNTFGVQYGVGPGTGIGGQCCSRMGRAGLTTNGSDVTRMRVFDSLWIQPTKQWSAEMVVLHQKDKSNAAGGTTTWNSFGVRPVYAIHKNVKLQAELGMDRVSLPGNTPAMRLTKITIAPTITIGEDYWARPELRAFVTHGSWNTAATAAVNAANESGKVYGNATSGTSVGIQVESWF